MNARMWIATGCVGLWCIGGFETGWAQAQLQPKGTDRVQVAVDMLRGSNDQPVKIPTQFEKLLKKPPFTSYSSWTVTQSNSLSLAPNQTQRLSIPGGGTFELTIRSAGPKPKFDYKLNGTQQSGMQAQLGQKQALLDSGTRDRGVAVVVGF